MSEYHGAPIFSGPAVDSRGERHLFAKIPVAFAKVPPIATDLITEILMRSRTIAVVGLSSRHTRPSYGVAEYLQRAGYRIFPVNPNETEVLDVPSVPRLEDHSESIDIVDIFRRSEQVPEIVESAIAMGAKAIWMQEGVVHQGAAARARQAGLAVVMDLCIMKEHASRFRQGRE